MKNLIATFFFTTAMAFAADPASTLKTVNGITITSEVAEGKGESIKANSQGEYGGGVIIGRPVKASLRGLFWKTYELQVNQGGFKDSNSYLGAVVDLSTDSKAVFEQFDKLNRDALYVFEYKAINPFNPEIEDKKHQVVAIYTPEEFLKKKGVTQLPAEIRSGDTHQGPLSDGVRSGRIVDVERYGFFGNFCSFELNVGGLKSTGTEGGSTEALMQFTVLDEEVCRYLEAAIALGQDVDISYTEDAIELWNPSGYYCKGVKCSAGTLASKFTADELNALKHELVRDPKFIQDVVEAIRKQNVPK